MTSQDRTIGMVGLAAVGFGLALAIPGLLMVVRMGELETAALDRYQPDESDARPIYEPVSSHRVPGGSGPTTFSLSLLSFTF